MTLELEAVQEVSVTWILQNVTESVDFPILEWEHMIHAKASDTQFPRLVEAIMDEGFTTPVCIFHDGHGWSMGNGHHRVAAAILLGLETIPVYASDDDYMCSEVTHTGYVDDVSYDEAYEFASFLFE